VSSGGHLTTGRLPTRTPNEGLAKVDGVEDLIRDGAHGFILGRFTHDRPRERGALLDDLAAFQFSSQGHPHTFYCLQPVVVRRSAQNDWELVDGQQRLATIFLIMGPLRDLATILKRDRYEITYRTPKETTNFLKQPTPEGAVGSIDNHYVYLAHQAIARWFQDKDGLLRLRLLDCLTSPDDTAPNVRVIWYELDENQNPVHAFVRLNVGRIPLTSAELIRAQLLRSDRPLELEQRDAHQIPQDWDLIERQLQNNKYWYFLQTDITEPAARIEYLFEIFMRMKRPETMDDLSNDPLGTFLAFQTLLELKDAMVREIWRDFKKLTETLEDWFEDDTSYHLVGFLIATATSDKGSNTRRRQGEAKVLVKLMEARRNSTGTAFDRHLRQLAWRHFVGPRPAEPEEDTFADGDLTQRIAERIEGLRYGDGAVRAVLLLFNIASLLEWDASTQRFQFDGYKKNSWDIEHVRSVAEYVPRAAASRKRWLEHVRRFIESPFAKGRDRTASEDLARKIDALLIAPSLEEHAFMDVFGRVRALSGETEAREDDDALSNLALLDTGVVTPAGGGLLSARRHAHTSAAT
jgi:Protein of unknown function DUF262